MLQGFDVLQELRPHLEQTTFLKTYEAMKQEGYELYALYDENEAVAVTGIITLTNFYDGYHIYVYDLVTKSTERSKGIRRKTSPFHRGDGERERL